jgi:Protein of unknown function (DUF3604)
MLTARLNRCLVVCFSLLLPGLVSCSKLDDPTLFPEYVDSLSSAVVAKDPVATNPDRNLFFGDLHIHTSLSTDAYVFGVRSLPEDVYSFAKGMTIEHGAGYPIKISRPLDFAAVTDHAEYLGQARLADLDVPTNQRTLRNILLDSNPFSITLAWIRSTMFVRNKGFGFGLDKPDPEVNRAAWNMTIDAAEENNAPGVFTAFIAYEWSSFADSNSVHIHRNVIYRNEKVSEAPFSYLDSKRPEDLWDFLAQESEQGRDALAIPHNANLSNGNMYRAFDSEGQAVDASYAAMRSRFEPISEILQIKGCSETHPLLSSLDEFANFEIAGLGDTTGGDGLESVRGSYARDALRLGMELAHSEGFNPYDFGVIGSSDSHNASSPVEENNYHGKLPMMDGSAGLRTDEATLLPAGVNPVTKWGSGGLAGIWAQENTRESLFDAMQSKETFATSGPRISVRFFAGWEFDASMTETTDVISRAYAGGVPMGGKLAAGDLGVSPGFLILALKDPEGANLDRAQIVKIWVDSDGVSHERIFDVAWSGDRSVDQDTGKLPPVGNTVDARSASYTNDIGSATLSVLWTDPEFDAAQNAAYYARVLEIPTPRWSTFDAKSLGIEPMDPIAIQERAITSAIWYEAP